MNEFHLTDRRALTPEQRNTLAQEIQSKTLFELLFIRHDAKKFDDIEVVNVVDGELSRRDNRDPEGGVFD